MRTRHLFARRILTGCAALTLAWGLASGCSGSDDTKGANPGDPVSGLPTDFAPGTNAEECAVDSLLPPHAYGNKVKKLLTGLPLTSEELAALTKAHGNDQAAAPEADKVLSDLIGSWLKTSEAQANLRGFFRSAFQQDGGNPRSLAHLLGRRVKNSYAFLKEAGSGPKETLRAEQLLHEVFAQSFARTAEKLVSEGRSFSDVLTSKRYEMTVPQMVFLAFRDDELVGDNGNGSPLTTNNDFDAVRLVSNKNAAPNIENFYDATTKTATFFDERLNRWDPDCSKKGGFFTCDCTTQPSQLSITSFGNQPTSLSFAVFNYLVLGEGLSASKADNPGLACALKLDNGGYFSEPLLSLGDYQGDGSWYTVDIEQPSGHGNEVGAQGLTKFWQVPKLAREARMSGQPVQLKLRSKQAGFISSAGFLSTWPSNIDNQLRVTSNQAVLVALGQGLSGVLRPDYTPKYGGQSLNDSDDAHASDPECYACHQTLEPMRTLLLSSLNYRYSHQLDSEKQKYTGQLYYGSMERDGQGIEDFAQMLSEHDWFPIAWTQKLCRFANAAPCPKGEELDRVVSVFKDSGLRFDVLLKTLFSSPLTTGSRCGTGLGAPPEATIARRGTFCSQFNHGVGSEASSDGTFNLCGQDGTRPLFKNSNPNNDLDKALRRNVKNAMAAVPADTYSRGQAATIVNGNTSLFIYGNREASCSHYAKNQPIDSKATNADEVGAFDQAFVEGLSRQEAIGKLLNVVMGLVDGHPMREDLKALLEKHATTLETDGNDERTIRQSLFMVACMSPGSAGVGF